MRDDPIQDAELRRLCERANAYAFIPPIEPTTRVGGKKRCKMATKVKLARGKEFVFARAKGFGGEIKYPWDEWFSGDLLLLERSEGPENSKGTVIEGQETTKRDYGVPRDAMPPKIKTAARRRYKIVQISRRDADGAPLDHEGLIIKARDMTADERIEEDLLRAEEREAAKAKKAGAGALHVDGSTQAVA